MKAHRRLMAALEDLTHPSREAENQRFNRLAGRGSHRGRYQIRQAPSGSYIAFHPDSGEYLGPTPAREMLDFLMERSDDIRAGNVQRARILGKRVAFTPVEQTARHEMQAKVWKESLPL
jgi:hypothetical protein